MTDQSKIWSEFTAVRDGKQLKFRIEELPKEKFVDLFEFYFDHFVPEESIHKGAEVANSDKSFSEYKGLMLKSLDHAQYQMDACYLVGDDGQVTLVGGSLMVLDRAEDPPINWDHLLEVVQTQEVKKFLTAVKIMANSYHEKEELNLKTYFDDRGITVHRNYRRLGMAEELFKARVLICRYYGVPMTGAWMSAYGTQKAAAKLGWETVCELSFDDISKASNITFVNTPPTCKLMVTRA